MSKLKNYERLDREIFVSRSNGGQTVFAINSTVLLGKKGSNNTKLDPIKEETYDSKKYSNTGSLSKAKIYTGDYITFSYNDFERNNSEEVFCSYPHLEDVKRFFADGLDLFYNDEVYDNNNQVTMKYKDFMLQSPYFGGEKQMVLMPSSIEINDKIERCCYLFVNNQDNYVPLDFKAMYTINVILNEINLLSLSNQTIIISSSALGSNIISSTSNNYPRPNPMAGKPLFQNQNNVGNMFSPKAKSTGSVIKPRAGTKPLPTTTKKVVKKVVEEEYQPEIVESENFDLKPNETIFKGGTMLNNILKEAEHIDFKDEGDEEVNFE